MQIEAFYNYCISLPGATDGFPFDKKTLVFKVKGKIFALTDIDKFESINLKCDPLKALELRAVYEEIQPGYHMNKKHWNTVNTKGGLKDEFILELIRHSYDLVVEKLPKKDRIKLTSL
ncbi:MmcQ/YjbR family DNA-binding protein [Gracilimonas halophila]|uniref:MmcQ/YjbR family DNA-binding protein n=1 Tax=Gracilimonas halophila TaxID=1834464 RepID=A0ABW5JFQ0_9BACT